MKIHTQLLTPLLLSLASAPLLAEENLQQQINQLQFQLEQTTQAVENLMQQPNNASGVNIGGYGELHYNNLDSGKEIDYHRFVLFFSKSFSERIHFFSELELEHALSGEGQPGEMELEQAAIRFDLSENHSVTGGLFLLPVGLLNETHEPPTFFGTERNPVEKNIIPTTWWEAGTMASGKLSETIGYDLAITSGLNVITDVTNSNAYKPRKGRQKVASAKAESLAYTARLNWQIAAGSSIGITAQLQEDVSQGIENAAANMIEAHASIQSAGFALRALYASWTIDSANAKTLGRDQQTGWYVEPSYKISSQWGLFARYNEWDNEAGNDTDSVKKQTDLGINYWPHPNVVIKADYQDQTANASDDGYNLGIGYQF